MEQFTIVSCRRLSFSSGEPALKDSEGRYLNKAMTQRFCCPELAAGLGLGLGMYLAKDIGNKYLMLYKYLVMLKRLDTYQDCGKLM